MKVKAIMTDAGGNPIKGTEQTFDEAHWTRMKRTFGKGLRWREVSAKAKKETKVEYTKSKKTYEEDSESS